MSESRKPENKEFKASVDEAESIHETAQHHERQEYEHHQPEQNKPSLEELAKTVEAHARSKAEHRSEPETKQDDHHPVLVSKQLKDMAYTRTMIRVRKQLTLPSKLFSKAVHSPILDRSSEFVGKTVARPSAMFGGALTAFIGASILLWAVKHYGYEYNYLVALLLFVVGAILGVIIEAVLRFTNRPR